MTEQLAPPRLDTPNVDSQPDGGPLRCQWCSVALSPGVTTCPTCGSHGIPDPRVSVAGSAPDIATSTQTPIELVEWWREDDVPGKPGRAQITYEEAENRSRQTIIFIAAAVIGCAITGWLAGPLLAGAMESLTGAPVDNPSDLRPAGGFLGLMLGFAVGATGGWIIWSGR